MNIKHIIPQSSLFGAIALVLSMTMTADAQPPSFLDLGVVGTPMLYIFDAHGNNLANNFETDTELGLWDSAGTLLASDDDGGCCGFSSIFFTLPAGEYFLGISEHDSVFVDNFTNVGSGFESGDVANVDLFVVTDEGLSTAASGRQLAGHPDTGNVQTAFFRIEVVPEPLKGDVDLDGDVDFDDIGPFIAALQSGVFQAEADCDCSTVVDFGDISTFIAILQSQ